MRSIILMLMFAITKSIFAQCDLNNAVFPIHPDECRHLRYYVFSNNLDSLSYNLTFGEVSKTVAGNTERIYLQTNALPDLGIYQFVRGDDTYGTDEKLKNIAHTSTFTYQTGASLKFYRALEGGVKCGRDTDPYDDDAPQDDEFKDHWKWISKFLDDEAEFVTEIVRLPDSTVVAILDSIGIKKNDLNPNSAYINRYGTNPDHNYHEFVLPPGPDNAQVFIRIKPKRWGTTPAGFKLYISMTEINLSFIKEKQPYSDNNYKCSRSTLDLIMSTYLSKLIQYSDSLKLTLGYVPSDVTDAAGYRLPSELTENFYMPRYYTSSYDSIDGPVYYQYPDFTINPGPAYKASMNIQEISGRAAITSISPMPIFSNSSLNIKINSILEFEDAKIKIYDLLGRDNGVIWTGQIKKGINSIAAQLDNVLDSKFYTLILLDGENNLINQVKIVKQ